MSRRVGRIGFTLAEVLIAGALATAMLGVIIYLFFNFSRSAEQPLASMSMDQATFGLMRWLQRDLSETNLQTIWSLPDSTGVVMASPRDFAQTSGDHLVFSGFGTVAWQKYVVYRVQMLPPDPNDRLAPPLARGELIYEEKGYAAGENEPIFPNQSVGDKNTGMAHRRRELSRSFLIDERNNGFSVYWNDSNNVSHPFTETERGEPVCVLLSLLEVSPRTGQPTIRRVGLQVKPRN